MKNSEKNLLGLFGRLAPGQQDKLMAFAEFLATGLEPAALAQNDKSVVIPRPGRETVTLAIRRLVRSYPMLDRRKLMGEASQLMAQHALADRAANEVIDDLEAVFARHYQQHKSKGESRKSKV